MVANHIVNPIWSFINPNQTVVVCGPSGRLWSVRWCQLVWSSDCKWFRNMISASIESFWKNHAHNHSRNLVRLHKYDFIKEPICQHFGFAQKPRLVTLASVSQCETGFGCKVTANMISKMDGWEILTFRPRFVDQTWSRFWVFGEPFESRGLTRPERHFCALASGQKDESGSKRWKQLLSFNQKIKNSVELCQVTTFQSSPSKCPDQVRPSCMMGHWCSPFATWKKPSNSVFWHNSFFCQQFLDPFHWKKLSRLELNWCTPVERTWNTYAFDERPHPHAFWGFCITWIVTFLLGLGFVNFRGWSRVAKVVLETHPYAPSETMEPLLTLTPWKCLVYNAKPKWKTWGLTSPTPKNASKRTNKLDLPGAGKLWTGPCVKVPGRVGCEIISLPT